MDKRKKLNRRQFAVIEDMFSGELDEQAVLDKHKVSKSLYNKWLCDDGFAEQFERRIAASYRQSAALIARYATLAAAKLVQLTESTSPETARKACLDIISMQGKATDTGLKTADNEHPAPVPALSPETASKILEVLAKEGDRNEK